ncbi:MAG: HEAT repeat domain-containing protein [Vicinamibacteraceae bacterium]
MPMSRDDVLALLDSEEPDYRAAALAVGGEAFDALSAMVEEADVSVASRAASLAATVAASSPVDPQTVAVLASAAGHADPSVRAAAALGASRIGAAARSVTTSCLADADAGVRLIAFRGLSVPLDPVVAAAVTVVAAADPQPMVRQKAAALAARNPDPSLANELLGVVLDYAQARLAELRDAALFDVPSFALATGRVGFIDVGGALAAQLAAARSALDLTPPRMAAADFAGAAVELGHALGAIRDATLTIGGGASLPALLASSINWAAAVPGGFAKQLGLPAVAPNLTIVGNALVYTLAAPGRTLLPAPLTLGFDRAELRAQLQLDGGSPPLSVALALTGIEAGVGGGPIASLIGGAGGSVHADVSFGVDTVRGLTLGGGAGARVVLPARPKVGPLDLREISLELPVGLANTIDIGSTITADIGGIITATVDGAGLHVRIDPAAVSGGDSPLSVSLKPPTGIGLVLDAAIVRGGGFLGLRPSGAYGGALQLRLGPVEVKAVGLLDLSPNFALVVVMSVEFLPPIDLTFGFTLNAVGGVIGIEHRLDTDALRSGISSGALDHIMFPADPVAAAPAILTTLEQIFPIEQGSIVIGPMVELGWGRPVSFLTAQLGVILSLPDPKIVIIGRVRIALPAPQLPIVDLRATIYGEITPDHLLILVSLNGSRIACFTVGGDIGLLLRWGGSPEVAISAGGFHPHYDPPRELVGMRRLSMDLSPPAILVMRAESYFAITSNSVQLGARIEMAADLGIVEINGHLEFDALIVFAPHFAFEIVLGAGLTVRVFGATLLGIHIELHLSGPAPWRAEGHAEVEMFWITVSIDVGPFTWGDADNPPPAPADPRQLARDALHHNPGAWQALVPPDADRVVRLALARPSDVEVTVHPMGLFDVRQHAIPLETVIVRVGANPVPEGQRRVHFGVPLVNGAPAGALSEVTDLFSAGTYLDLSEDQKLSRPSFEPMPAGARIRPPGDAASFTAAREADLRYETFVCDDSGTAGVHGKAFLDVLFASSPFTTLAAGSAGRSDLRARTRYATAPDPIVLAHPGEVEVVSKVTVTAAVGVASATYTRAAEQPLAADTQLARLGVA